MVFPLLTLTDKPFMGSVVSGANAARHASRMCDIAFGGREAIERDAGRHLAGQLQLAAALGRPHDRVGCWSTRRANQAIVITPFLLMGAMSPGLDPGDARAADRRGARRHLPWRRSARPGCPVILGSFLSNIDMQSGSPQFGTPESAIGLLCTGQIARRFGLPWRCGGGLTSSQTADAQAAYEAMMTMLPTFLAGTNWVMHSAGWLESGLV